MKFYIPSIGSVCLVILPILLLLSACTSDEKQELALSFHQGDHVVMVGSNLCSRMINFGHFETELFSRFPDSSLVIRNMCDGGNTPGFRPHSGRESPWAFPGAARYQTELAKKSGSIGHFESPDGWLNHLDADVILAFFGYNESFRGEPGLATFKDELDAFIDHTLHQNYNGANAPTLAVISPIAFEDLSDLADRPDGITENENLALYTEGMREVVSQYDHVLFVDAFQPSLAWYEENSEPLTIDGSQLSDHGYEIFGEFLADELFGTGDPVSKSVKEQVHASVMEKNWFWHNDFKIPNGVHVFGRRYEPFGPDNYPAELTKIRQMTSIRDTAIWMACHGEQKDLAAADAKTLVLPPVETNYEVSEKNGNPRYLYGQEALDQIEVAPGYHIELFASEEEFEDLANPVQLSFDNQGRLWVAVMPSYPHYKPGDQRPDDKIIILEDTDGDYKADKQTTFADGLHLPIGFEIAPEGVYVSQGTNLKLFTDTDGDDRADRVEILMSGFDDHDTHHAISAFCADPSGAIMMGEGVFLHTNVETSYGPVRGTNGGFFRYNPQRRQLERHAQLSIPNPWGIAFDRWGEHFFCETSGPDVRWMLPGSVKPRYGVATHKSFNLIEDDHRVRPTSGLEFVSSRHFPDEVQGDLLINNTIGFLGTKMHKMEDDGTGYTSSHRLDLIKGNDKNFRPVDMEFAPDGSLYVVDWHNVLIGHMQHNARDPLRDHVHGRIYRITYPSRPLVEPAKIDGATIEELLNNLKLPEYRTRYRTRRELRGRDADEVLTAVKEWVAGLDPTDPEFEHYRLEALWVTWGMNKVDEDLLKQILTSDDYRARAAAVRVLRYTGHLVPDQPQLLLQAASDPEGRVRLEAIIAASWIDPEFGLPIIEEAANHPLDEWMIHAHETAKAHLNGRSLVEEKEVDIVQTDLEGLDRDLFIKGKEIYEREGFCMTCHQADGQGLVASGFPPIAGTQWALGSSERLIKLTLNGLHGPIEVLGRQYPGQVPMTPFAGMLNDEEISAVLTYVRNAFGNEADPIYAEEVEKVRSSIQNRPGFYSPEELLQEYPLEREVQ